MASQRVQGQDSHAGPEDEQVVPSSIIAQAEAAIQGHLDEDEPPLKKSKTHTGGGQSQLPGTGQSTG